MLGTKLSCQETQFQASVHGQFISRDPTLFILMRAELSILFHQGPCVPGRMHPHMQSLSPNSNNLGWPFQLPLPLVIDCIAYFQVTYCQTIVEPWIRVKVNLNPNEIVNQTVPDHNNFLSWIRIYDFLGNHLPALEFPEQAQARIYCKLQSIFGPFLNITKCTVQMRRGILKRHFEDASGGPVSRTPRTK